MVGGRKMFCDIHDIKKIMAGQVEEKYQEMIRNINFSEHLLKDWLARVQVLEVAEHKIGGEVGSLHK